MKKKKKRSRHFKKNKKTINSQLPKVVNDESSEKTLINPDQIEWGADEPGHDSIKRHEPYEL